MSQDFIDLRPDRAGGGSSEDFWPSFTDIMMVVVMIFMITSLVLIMRNRDLVAEMRSTLEAERAARAEASEVLETSRSLEAQLTEAQNALSESRIRNLQLAEENLAKERQLEMQAQELLDLRTEQEQTVGELESTRRQSTLLGDQLRRVQSTVAQLENELQRRTARLEDLLANMDQLEQQYQANLEELGAARRERATISGQLSSLQGRYSELEEEYQKLLRPARSAEGKQIAEVRLFRKEGETIIQIRPPGQERYEAVSREEMHQRLSSLQDRHKRDLYVKIIIPPDSGLSYNEAWDFTRKTLNRYDYYYQE